jgi:hypothetical protein
MCNWDSTEQRRDWSLMHSSFQRKGMSQTLIWRQLASQSNSIPRQQALFFDAKEVCPNISYKECMVRESVETSNAAT